MYKIGVVSINETNKNLKGLSKEAENLLCQFEETHSDHLFYEIFNLDGIIIQNLLDKDMKRVFEMIIEIKRNSDIPVWTYKNNTNSLNRLVTLQLGVLGNVDDSASVGEIDYSISNMLTLLERNTDITKEEIASRKETSTIELNERNLSMIFEGDKEVSLTNLEYKMMGLLMKKTNSVIGYEAISKDIWGGSLNDDRQFKTANLIFNLRTKLKKNAIDAL